MFHSRPARSRAEETTHAIERLRRLLPEPARLLPVTIEPRRRRTTQDQARSPAPPAPAPPDAPDPPDDPFDMSDLNEPFVPGRTEPQPGPAPPPGPPQPPGPPGTGPPTGLTDPNDDIPDVEVAPARLRRGHVVVIAVVLLVAVLGASVLLLRSRPSTEPLAQPSTLATVLATGTPIASSTGVPAGFRRTSQGAAFLLVHVAGKVRRPGVVRLPAGARVYDAVEAAGGARPGVDLSTLNLARPLVDGEQVLVGVEQSPQARGSPPPGPVDGLPTSSAPAEPLDLNTATAEQLDLLPGVGPVLAQRIIQARDQRGGFTTVDELREVSGIGERKYAELRERVTVR